MAKIISFTASATEILYLEKVSRERGCSTSQAVRDCITVAQDGDRITDIESAIDNIDAKLDVIVNVLRTTARPQSTPPQQAARG